MNNFLAENSPTIVMLFGAAAISVLWLVLLVWLVYLINRLMIDIGTARENAEALILTRKIIRRRKLRKAKSHQGVG